MAPNSSMAVVDRVTERRRAVALARHYREAEGLSIAQIAERLGRSPATVKASFHDPAGEKARAVKARHRDFEPLAPYLELMTRDAYAQNAVPTQNDCHRHRPEHIRP